MRKCLVAAAILIGLHGIAFCQSTTLLRGSVTDPQGAAIPEASVKLIDAQTGLERQTLTGATGEYQFLQMSPGTYTISVEKPGFAPIARTGVNLLVNTPTTLDLRMALGQTTESVSVSAEASTINTVDASVGNAFSERQVRAAASADAERCRAAEPAARRHHERRGSRRAPRSEQHHARRRGRQR